MIVRIVDSCVRCLYDRQAEKTDNAEYLAEVRRILDGRREEDTSPYMVYLFNKAYTRIFGAGADYTGVKKEYNDLVLGMETALRGEIERAPDPLAKALVMARTGNYIDFGAMQSVDTEEFLSLFRDTDLRPEDEAVYASFLRSCAGGRRFLLLCDNCGEIVLDRLFLEQLHARFPHLSVKAMVRGGEVLNDVTTDDALYVGLDRVAEIVSNGEAVAGTIDSMLSPEGKAALDEADVILAKGQGNYETLSGQGRHVYYLFLCKCDLFTERFRVPRLTGMFVEETP